MYIDMNCDMGESFGHFVIGQDEEMMKWITSANLACGFHAGDPSTIYQRVQLAKKYKVAVGAHPSLPDLVGFGRREMKLTPDQLYCDLIYQIGAVSGFARMAGLSLQHVKVHGALYNMANRDPMIAETIVNAISDFDPNLIVFGISDGELLRMAEKKGLRIAREFFADRTYMDDGSLTPRNHKDALIDDPVLAAERVVRLIQERKVIALSGKEIPMEAETVCIHGDGPNALSFAMQIKQALEKEGIVLKSLIDQ